ncbi:MAG: DUF4386 domain-containing protein [Crocinitomicaceae bacterium]
MTTAQLTQDVSFTSVQNSNANQSPMLLARIAGVLYVIITIAAIIAHMVVPEQLIVAGDATTTASNITSNEGLFRMAIGSELILLLSEVVLSIILYVLLKPVNRMVSLIAAVSRLVMTTIHGLNLLNYFFVLVLLSGADYLNVFNTEQINSFVMLFLEAHAYGFAIGIAFLIIHVFALGYLIFKAGYVPRILGVLFIFAGFGYLVDSVGILLLPAYETTPALAAIVIAIAELAFPIWLLVKGVNRERYEERVTTTT